MEQKVRKSGSVIFLSAKPVAGISFNLVKRFFFFTHVSIHGSATLKAQTVVMIYKFVERINGTRNARICKNCVSNLHKLNDLLKLTWLLATKAEYGFVVFLMSDRATQVALRLFISLTGKKAFFYF